MSSSAPIDTATIAFRRVLAESTGGEQARVDALVVLAQRTLFAATWPGPNQVVRTLTNSDGQTALPLFTGVDSLETTATRFGWREPDGSLQFRELAAREALEHALARGVHFVVLDIGSAYSVEFSREELAPVLELQVSADATAAGSAGRAAILNAVQQSNRPGRTAAKGAQAAAGSGEASVARQLPKRPISQSLTGHARPPSVKPPPVLSANDNHASPHQRTPIPGFATSGAGSPARGAHAANRAVGRTRAADAMSSSATERPGAPPTRDGLRTHTNSVVGPRLVLSDALRLGISASLRAFPEVEWACVLADETTIPVIGVRVDSSFLNRVAEITDAILGAAEKQGMQLQVLLLNNAELVKSAHKHGQAFYPWRK